MTTPAAPDGQTGDRSAPPAGGWRWDAHTLRTELERRGFDVVDDAPSPLSSTTMLRGRRERGTTVWVVVIDASGSLRAERTTARGEWAGGEEVAGVALRVIEEVRRTTTVSGTLVTIRQLRLVLDALDWLAGDADKMGTADAGDR